MPAVVGRRPATGSSTAWRAARPRTRGLVLKGDLAKFPFRNPKDGTFRVTARVTDGLLDYAPGWPKIEGISGELLFEGAGMRIKGQPRADLRRHACERHRGAA